MAAPRTITRAAPMARPFVRRTRDTGSLPDRLWRHSRHAITRETIRSKTGITVIASARPHRSQNMVIEDWYFVYSGGARSWPASHAPLLIEAVSIDRKTVTLVDDSGRAMTRSTAFRPRAIWASKGRFDRSSSTATAGRNTIGSANLHVLAQAGACRAGRTGWSALSVHYRSELPPGEAHRVFSSNPDGTGAC
jgi:hypothetical protein